MTVNHLFNHSLFSEENKKQLRALFNNNTPIRHVVIDNFLEEKFAAGIHDHFPSIREMKTHYHGLNENKSEDSNFNALDSRFSQLHAALSSEQVLQWIESWTGLNQCSVIEDRLGYGLHQGGNKSFLDIHIDYNIHPIKKLYRKLNLILFFNPVWETNWGGHLELWDQEVKKCSQSIAPVFNRCVIFECSDISYHGYSKITVPDHITRKSYYQYYFIPLGKDEVYHDTIFKPRPQEKLIKKVLTPVKETLKNSAKRIILKMGLEKLIR
jgi:Rps23 Pro-64 3,4-dihydroxylase Tpa1-like proline 4-hydroxylase